MAIASCQFMSNWIAFLNQSLIVLGITSQNMILWVRVKFRALLNSPIKWILSDINFVVSPACPTSCLNSPEPLIAEAAAQIMNGSDTMTLAMDTWELLLEYVNNGLGGQGDIGELIGHALSILAMDAAINNLDNICKLKYQTSILVNDYYKGSTHQ